MTSPRESAPPGRMAERLLALRKEHGLTQAEVAKILGVTSHAVAHWEAGRGGVSLRHQRDLARLYDVSLSVVRGDEPIPKPTKARIARIEAELAAAEKMVRPGRSVEDGGRSVPGTDAGIPPQDLPPGPLLSAPAD